MLTIVILGGIAAIIVKFFEIKKQSLLILFLVPYHSRRVVAKKKGLLKDWPRLSLLL